MSQHTPGPWTVERITHAEIYSGSVFVADVMIDTDGLGWPNARLIAAAPEMLLWITRAMGQVDDAMYFEARALLAKIEGGNAHV